MVNYTCMQNVKLLVGENCHEQMGEALSEAGYKKRLWYMMLGSRQQGSSKR